MPSVGQFGDVYAALEEAPRDTGSLLKLKAAADLFHEDLGCDVELSLFSTTQSR